MAKEIKIDDKSIVGIIRNDLDRAKDWQNDLRSNREQMHLLYSMSKEADGIKLLNKDGFSQTVSSMVYKSVEGMKVGLEQIFTSPDFFAVKINKQQEASERIRKFLRWNIFENQYGAREMRYWLDTTLKYEIGVLKCYFDTEYTEDRQTFKQLDYQQTQQLLSDKWEFEKYEQVFDYQPSMELDGSMSFQPVTVALKNVKAIKRTPKFIGVKLEAVDPETFFYSPDSDNIDKCRVVAQKIFLSAEDIKKGEEQGTYRKGSYEKILKANFDSDEYYDDTQYRYDSQDLDSPNALISYQTEEQNKSAKPVIIWEIYTKIDLDKSGYLKPVIIHALCNNSLDILSVQENSYGRPPFRVAKAIEAPFKLEGIPYPQSLEQITIELTQQRRMFNDATADSIYGNMITADEQLAENWRDRIMGGVILASKPSIVSNQEYSIVRGGGLDPTILQAIEMHEGQGEEVSGVTRYNQGIDADSLNSTATGISIISSMSQQRQKYMANVIAETYKDILEDMVQAFKLFGGEYIDYFISKGNEINIQDYANDFSIEIELGIGQQEKQQQAGVIKELIPLAIQDITQGGGMLFNLTHLAGMIDRIGQLTGTPLESFHYSEQEIEQRQIQKQQQQQAQAMAMQQQQAMMAQRQALPQQVQQGALPQ